MCIPKDYKYKPHPLLRALPNLYDIRCVLMLNYESKENDDKICVKCYDRERPRNYELIVRHGLIDGRLMARKCQCGHKLVRIRSILRCNKCFSAYVQFIVNFRELYSYEIAFLMIDVLSAIITSLSIYDEYGTEIEVQLE